MKRILFVFIIIFLILATPLSIKASAEEVTIDTNEQAEVEAEEYEPTIEDFKNEVQAWLQQYMEESLVVKIITWLIDAGVLTSLFVVYLKYRKYKHTTIEDLTKQFGDKVGGWLKDDFNNLSQVEINKILKSITELEKANETMMKVLVLMQDSSAKGKVALIEYLGSKTNNEEIHTAITDVNESLEKQEEAMNEVKQKVSGDYEEIF